MFLFSLHSHFHVLRARSVSQLAANWINTFVHIAEKRSIKSNSNFEIIFNKKKYFKLQPYVCDRCNKACSSSTYLKKHKKACRPNPQPDSSAPDEYIEITSIPTTHEDHNIPESGSIILTEVESSETFYVRIDGIHDIIDPSIDDHSLVNLSQSDGVEILNEMMPSGQNESDNTHVEEKHLYQTLDSNCMGIQVQNMEDVVNVENEQYFITSDCIVNK